ncbi:MAG: hypothetical protein AB9917_03295 [Negativicutes bacterium]
MDADLGTANVDVVLGLTPTYHLGHVVSSGYYYGSARWVYGYSWRVRAAGIDATQ